MVENDLFSGLPVIRMNEFVLESEMNDSVHLPPILKINQLAGRRHCCVQQVPKSRYHWLIDSSNTILRKHITVHHGVTNGPSSSILEETLYHLRCTGVRFT